MLVGHDKTGQTENVISIRVIRAIRGSSFAPIHVPKPCGRLGVVKSRAAAGLALAVFGNHGLHGFHGLDARGTGLQMLAGIDTSGRSGAEEIIEDHFGIHAYLLGANVQLYGGFKTAINYVISIREIRVIRGYPFILRGRDGPAPPAGNCAWQ